MPPRGKIINGTKYIYLCDDNEFKKKSLEDNIYFTLRDIFMNAEDAHETIEANEFNYILSNGIKLEERTDAFQYVNVLQNKEYISNLINFMKRMGEHSFEFTELQEDDDEPMSEYIRYDDWWVQFDELKNLLNYHNKNM